MLSNFIAIEIRMINCKSQSELAKMKRSGQIVRQVLVSDSIFAYVADLVRAADAS